MRKSEIRAAGVVLRAITDEIHAGELAATGGVVARLEGALDALGGATALGGGLHEHAHVFAGEDCVEHRVLRLVDRV